MHITTQTLIIVETHSESLVLFSIFKSTHPPTNKKPRLESIKLQSGYETDLSPQIATMIKPENSLTRL